MVEKEVRTDCVSLDVQLQMGVHLCVLQYGARMLKPWQIFIACSSGPLRLHHGCSVQEHCRISGTYGSRLLLQRRRAIFAPFDDLQDADSQSERETVRSSEQRLVRPAAACQGLGPF